MVIIMNNRNSLRSGTAFSMIALTCLTLMSAGCSDSKTDNTAKSDTNIADTAKLPRLSGAKEVYASPATTIFTSPQGVAPTADAIEKTLNAAGWQSYKAPHSAIHQDQTMKTLMLKKGAQALNVFINIAQAQNNAVNVQYSFIPLATDLPFTKDASDIEYSPDQPLLLLLTSDSIDKTLDFYRKEMTARGWSLWSAKANGKASADELPGTVHERGAYAHYITDKNPAVALVLTLQKQDDGKTRVEIKQWPIKVLESARMAYLNRDNTAPLAEVAKLPRLPGAKETERSKPDNTSYSVPGNLPAISAAIKSLLTADGWTFYVAPLDQPHSTWLTFIKGQQGLSVHFTISPGTNEVTTDQTTVSYNPTRLQFALPIPQDASDVIFDDRRPYLQLLSGSAADILRDFYTKKLAANDWAQLSNEAILAKWPHARLDTDATNGSTTYFIRGNDRPIMLTLRPRDNGKVLAEIMVPSFARSQTVEADSDLYGLPMLKPRGNAGGTNGTTRREVHAQIPASVDAVESFYRRELATRGWKEIPSSSPHTPDGIAINYEHAEGTATLHITRQHDMTVMSLEQNITKPSPKAEPSASGGSIDAMLREAQKMIREADNLSNAKPAPAQQPVNAPAESLQPLAGNQAPVPVPHNAEGIDFDGDDGKLEFSTPSSVKAVADFYRARLKGLGWRSEPSVINNSNMAQMNFNKSGRTVAFTIMRMGPVTNVSADGSGLKTTSANKSQNTSSGAPAAASQNLPPASDDDLTPEDREGLPVPKRRTSTGVTKTPFRRELNVSIPIDFKAVLDFYRRELGKRNWKEDNTAAPKETGSVTLRFSAPEGPGVLVLIQKADETNVILTLKLPEAAKKAGIAPPPGQAKILFGNILENASSLTFNGRTINVAAGAGTKAPDGPSLDVPPGKYKYSIKVPGRPTQSDEVEVGADETWGLMVGPGGILPLQAY